MVDISHPVGRVWKVWEALMDETLFYCKGKDCTKGGTWALGTANTPVVCIPATFSTSLQLFLPAFFGAVFCFPKGQLYVHIYTNI